MKFRVVVQIEMEAEDYGTAEEKVASLLNGGTQHRGKYVIEAITVAESLVRTREFG